jgi:hypothetical protein
VAALYKVVQVSDAEFEAAKAVEDHVVLTELALGGAEVAITFKPREVWAKGFGFYRLFK